MTRYFLVLACVMALAAFGCGSSTDGESTTPIDEAAGETTVVDEEPTEDEALPPVEAGEEEGGEEEGGEEEGGEDF